MTVEDHYSQFDPSHDLSRSDQLHTMGPIATAQLAELAAIAPGEGVLDVGCGIGGPARQLAALGAHVTGIDLTPAFCDSARELNRGAGVDIEIHCGSALDMPFDDSSFDVVWTQHATMNIEDKASLYREMRRVVRPGGRLAFFDVVAGANQPITFPVPWAQEPSMSFLIPTEEMRALIEAAGFAPRAWNDRSAVALEAMQAAGAMPNVVIPDWETKVRNHLANLGEDRIRLLQAVCDAV